jgi:hypothetical protein
MLHFEYALHLRPGYAEAEQNLERSRAALKGAPRSRARGAP